MNHRKTSAIPGARDGERPAASVEPTVSTDVRVWKVSKISSKTAPYQLRWKVAGRVRHATFTTSALAESRRSELWQAMRKGEAFDVETGLPESEVRAAAEEAKENTRPDPSWWDFVREYMGVRWRTAAAKTREGLADSLATAALGMMGEGPGAPEFEDVRRAVRWVVVPSHKDEEPPPDLEKACVWLSANALHLSALGEPRVVRDVHYRLSFRLDDKPAATDTYRRRRRGFNTAMEYAIQEGYLDANPLAGLKRPTSPGSDRVDRRVLVNEMQGRQLLMAVSYVGSVHRNRGRRLVTFFGCILYAAMRPAEVVGLRLADCHLPETGWGTLTLRETRPISGKSWTDSGDRHDRRGLKSREPGEDRPVPIPPVLVAMLRAHLKEFGTAKDGRLFPNERGTCSARPATGGCGRKPDRWHSRPTRWTHPWPGSRTTCGPRASRTGSAPASR